ncbi:MAG: NUDIX hydrolase, partial [bacterium]
MIKKSYKIKNHFYRISIKALILDNKKRFLLTLENNGLWELPGGGLDFYEKPLECLIREIKEETGLKITKINKQPSYFLTAPHSNGQYWICNILYEVKVKNLNFRPSNECM